MKFVMGLFVEDEQEKTLLEQHGQLDDPLAFVSLLNWVVAEKAGFHTLTFSMWVGVFSWGFPIVSVQTCAHLVYAAWRLCISNEFDPAT